LGIPKAPSAVLCYRAAANYEVHVIAVNWPHHVFVNKDFKVIGAE